SAACCPQPPPLPQGEGENRSRRAGKRTGTGHSLKSQNVHETVPTKLGAGPKFQLELALLHI
ncbi:hypothetical protein, partial [Enterobacter intestinihominis]